MAFQETTLSQPRSCPCFLPLIRLSNCLFSPEEMHIGPCGYFHSKTHFVKSQWMTKSHNRNWDTEWTKGGHYFNIHRARRQERGRAPLGNMRMKQEQYRLKISDIIRHKLHRSQITFYLQN